MPRRKIAKIKALSQDKGGRYIKNLGWVRNPNSGKFSQRKFLLGHDEETAKLAAVRLRGPVTLVTNWPADWKPGQKVKLKLCSLSKRSDRAQFALTS